MENINIEPVAPPLVNRVAASGIVTINLEDFFPKEQLLLFDLKNYLFMELILKEKDFRESLRQHDWAQYAGKNLAIFCSVDAIIPVWAYMLVASGAAPFAARIFQGAPDVFYQVAFQSELATFDAAAYAGQRVVIKGCSQKPVPPSAYVELTQRLRPFAQSIMYGEPCSMVPIYKKEKIK